MEGGNDIAFVFNRTHEDHRGMYAMLPEETDMPLSPDDQALLMGVYPATMTDFDLAATIAALPSTTMNELNISVDRERSSSGLRRPDLLPTAMPGDHYQHNHQHHHNQQMHHQQTQQPPAPLSTSPPGGYYDPSMVTRNGYERYRSQSDNASPTSSGHASDVATRDSEDILNAPVKSLTEEEKKLRRRAQVAKSARKHRNRQKVLCSCDHMLLHVCMGNPLLTSLAFADCVVCRKSWPAFASRCRCCKIRWPRCDRTMAMTVQPRSSWRKRSSHSTANARKSRTKTMMTTKRHWRALWPTTARSRMSFRKLCTLR